MTKKINGLTSFTLHILAMLFMLCDHLWATLFPAAEWLSCIGRLAFPIFAFMIAEGYSHTSNVKKYVLRLLICAVITEVPFDLFYGGTVFYPFHQNVLWTFLIALLTIILIEKTRKLKKRFLGWVLAAVTVLVSYAVGTLAMVDYYGAGILTVLVFYFFRERKWQNFAAQLVCLAVINIGMLKGMYYTFTFAGHEFELAQQGLALLALIPIWLYKGERGYHSRWFKWFCYAFYPAHLIILYIVSSVLTS